VKGRAGKAETTKREESKTIPLVVQPAPAGVTSPHAGISRSPRHKSRLITLLTDFGTADYFVAAMKGVILSLNPEVAILDISHEIPPQNISAGAFTLLASYQSFPPGAVNVAVVDPGVGSSRRPIIITAGTHIFVGPDNGLFSFICERHPNYHVFHLTNEHYFRHPVSSTFHGRDIFAPVAAALAKGVRPEEFGPEIKDEVRLESLSPRRLSERKLQARIIHIDRFGNCITNLTKDDLRSVPGYLPQLTVNGRTMKSFSNFFAEGTGVKTFAVWGSAGFLELAVTNQSAAKMLKIRPGQSVIVEMIKKSGSGKRAGR